MSRQSKKSEQGKEPSTWKELKDQQAAGHSGDIPSHFFTPRKAFSQEVASSPLVSDQEMDTLRAECGDDMLEAAENIIDEGSLSPTKIMGPPSCQKHPYETPNTKRDREIRQLLLQDLECSESERDTPYKKDTPQKKRLTTSVSSDESTLVPIPSTSQSELMPSTSQIEPAVSETSGRRSCKSSSSSSDEEESESLSESSGDELDVHSSNFNATKALTLGKNFLPKLPFPHTKRLNNLDQYKKVASASDDPEDFEGNMVRALKKKPLTKKSKDYISPSKHQESIKRNFLPHQMPVTRPIRENRHQRNLMDKMEAVKGPLLKLVEYRDKKIRVMVKTRNIYQGTNDMVGYLVAFDKHWNLALTDVEETFLRKMQRKVPLNLGESVKLSSEELARRGIVRPKVIQKVGNKFELCKRHIPQLLLRGEQIVVICPVI
ncbi:uncharacterized protein LOC132203686 [Neocloeon triangulifer]|uniref:uncharacterized protein LOC132203686 n=1 Tax=Neocloeon triangulifer TaxID=2078957 RepID=UPI00286F99E1|nr:uncharacterized protein LOC132203686 [Neocloeon triangulifer]